MKPQNTQTNCLKLTSTTFRFIGHYQFSEDPDGDWDWVWGGNLYAVTTPWRTYIVDEVTCWPDQYGEPPEYYQVIDGEPLLERLHNMRRFDKDDPQHRWVEVARAVLRFKRAR